jgi:DNA-3-methyladenine glycosylase II
MMGLSATELQRGIDALAAIEPGVAAAVARIGYPQPRIRPRGYATLQRTNVGQQVSVKAADSVWRKLEALVGDPTDPRLLLAQSEEDLRACGFSRQKQGYARSLAGLTAGGEIDFAHLPADDEAAIALLTRIKGIGRWSAEIYLLFAEGRADIWPAGDLAVQIELGRDLPLAPLQHRHGGRLTRQAATGASGPGAAATGSVRPASLARTARCSSTARSIV